MSKNTPRVAPQRWGRTAISSVTLSSKFAHGHHLVASERMAGSRLAKEGASVGWTQPHRVVGGPLDPLNPGPSPAVSLQLQQCTGHRPNSRPAGTGALGPHGQQQGSRGGSEVERGVPKPNPPRSKPKHSEPHGFAHSHSPQRCSTWPHGKQQRDPVVVVDQHMTGTCWPRSAGGAWPAAGWLRRPGAAWKSGSGTPQAAAARPASGR